jgi:hypothetical protein
MEESMRLSARSSWTEYTGEAGAAVSTATYPPTEPMATAAAAAAVEAGAEGWRWGMPWYVSCCCRHRQTETDSLVAKL